jgi:hypothetical protein
MTVDFESLATTLPIAFAVLLALAFAIGLCQQWAASRKRARASDGRSPRPRGTQVDDPGRDRR